MNNVQMSARRPVIQNVLYGLMFLAAEAVLVTAYFFLRNPKPQTLGPRLAEAIFFCVMLIGSLFLVMAAANCIRNLLSPPTFLLNNEQIYLIGRAVPLADVSKVELCGGKLQITAGEETLTLKKTDVNVPLETIHYAIQIRREQGNLI